MSSFGKLIGVENCSDHPGYCPLKDHKVSELLAELACMKNSTYAKYTIDSRMKKLELDLCNITHEINHINSVKTQDIPTGIIDMGIYELRFEVRNISRDISRIKASQQDILSRLSALECKDKREEIVITLKNEIPRTRLEGVL